jgi:hypothetical protein
VVFIGDFEWVIHHAGSIYDASVYCWTDTQENILLEVVTTCPHQIRGEFSEENYSFGPNTARFGISLCGPGYFCEHFEAYGRQPSI